MKIIEISDLIINNKIVYLHSEHLVHLSASDRTKGYVNIAFQSKNVNLPLFENNLRKEVCLEKDLQDILIQLGIDNVNISLLRLKIIDTKKWGKKPVYTQGADSVCFSCYHFDIGGENHLIIYNTSGTKAIEYLYIHGVWRVK